MSAADEDKSCLVCSRDRGTIDPGVSKTTAAVAIARCSQGTKSLHRLRDPGSGK